MRKNNKGFTLIEIIAVVAILGIMSVVVVPGIFSLINQSRDEIYLQDARRLVAQAQYKMSSNSSAIDKPAAGECIVMSLNYLNINDFQSPPHGGAYMSDASFVAIKSDGETYKYAAMLVEETSDGVYRGVKLATEEDLNAKNAHQYITSFTKGEIRYIDSETAIADGASAASAIDSTYISRNLRDYGTNQRWLPNDGDYIIGRYNYEKEIDKGTADTSVPKVNAKVISADSKNAESLSVNLTVTASDADSPLSSLKVCSKVSRNPDDEFPLAGSGFCADYGTSDSYSKSFDLTIPANGGFSYTEQAIAYVYVLVYDKENNSDRKKIEYYTHKNKAPVISSFEAKSSDNGKLNLSSVKLFANVSDDLDSISDLQFCLKQDKDLDNCTAYKSYGETFISGSYSYTLVDGNGKQLSLDGSMHVLKLFVKDKLGEVGTAEVKYQIYENKAPVFDKIKLIPNKIGDKNSYSTYLDIDASDDISNIYNLKITVGNNAEISMLEYMNREQNGLYAYEFENQTYDGSNRKVEIKLKDEHGKTTSRTLVLDNIYKNQAPNVTVDSITSSDSVCSNCDASIGGGYKTRVAFTITDDLVVPRDFASKNFKVCISENKSDCSFSKKENFKVYFGNETTYEFKKPSRYIYESNIAQKTLYVAVLDDYGAYNIGSKKYSIYKNQAPTINGSFSISTAEQYNYCDGEVLANDVCNGNVIKYVYNVPNVSVDTSNLLVADDFDNVTGEMCYTINDGSEQCIKIADDTIGNTDKSVIGFVTKLSSGFKFLENGKEISRLKNQKIKARIKLTDDYKQVSYSPYVEYTLFNDLAPEIKEVSLKTLNVDEHSNVIYNSNQLEFSFKVLDFNDTYTVCITEKDSCLDNEFVGVSGEKGIAFSGDFYAGNSLLLQSLHYNGKEPSWPADYKYSDLSNTNKKFNFFVKDSSGKVTKYDGNLEYKVYAACQEGSLVKEEVEEGEEEYIAVDNSKIIDASACEGKCYHQYSDKDMVPVVNAYTAKYSEMLSYIDNKTSAFCEKKQGDPKDLYCDSKLCFMFDLDNINYIGTKFFTKYSSESSDDEVWTYSNKLVTETVQGEEKPECIDALSSGNLLFCSDDTRCDSSGNYCEEQGNINCRTEEENVLQSAYTCSYEKLYNPKPCGVGETPENNSCFDMPLRACTPSETPNPSVCLKTCGPDETPEENLCTPYSSRDINDIYATIIVDPCTEGKDVGKECNFSSGRACSFGETPEDYGCIRQCEEIDPGDDGILDENDNISEDDYIEVEDLYYENPRTNNCTLKSGLTANERDEIRINCENNLNNRYETCLSNYRSNCNTMVTNGFCKNNKRSESWEMISCDDYIKDDVHKERYCEKDFIDGKCNSNSDKCGTCTATEIKNGVCDEKLERKNCQRVCYRKVDCSIQSSVQPIIFQCKGAYRVYQKNYVNGKIILQHVDNICPEFYNYYDTNLGMTGKDLVYPFVKNGNISNIWFSQDEQKNIGEN